MTKLLNGSIKPVAALSITTGLFSVAFLANQAPSSQSTPFEIAWTMLFTVFTAVCFMLLWLVIKRVSNDAATITLIGYIVFLFYGYIQRFMDDAVIFNFARDRFFYQDRIFLPASIVAIIIIYYASKTLLRLDYSVARYLSVLMLALTIWNLTLWGIGQTRSYSFTTQRATANISLNEPKELFPIYWMLFDGYGRDDILAEEFDFDNSPFLSELENRGFTIDKNAISYCPHTDCVIGALMELENFALLDEDSILSIIKNRATAHWRFEDSALVGLLSQIGYKSVELSSERSPIVASRIFPIAYYEKTGLNALHPKLHIWRYFNRLGLVKNMEETGSQANQKDVIVFSYNLAPHPPYYFDKNGKHLNPRIIEPDNKERMKTWDQKDKYIEQLQFVNSNILATVDEIIETSEVQPLIIVMSDHGPASNWNEGRIRHTPSEALFNERVPILSAVLIPKYCKAEEFGKSRSSVNTFNAVLNACFQTNIPMYADDVWWNPGNSIGHYPDGIWKMISD